MQQQFSWPISEVSVAAPAGWYTKQSWTILAPDGQANVIASSEPLGSGIDTEGYAREQGILLHREFPQLTEHSFGPFDLGGQHAMLRDFEWSPPDGVRVHQLQLYFVASGRGFTATATTPSTSFGRFRDVFLATLSRLRFGPWVGAADGAA